MPQRHQDTKLHKVLNINSILFVKLGVLVSLWQKRLFGVDSIFIFSHFQIMNKSQLFEQIKKKQSFLCVGLDSDIREDSSHSYWTHLILFSMFQSENN